MTNESGDVDVRNPEFQVYSYVCQAEAALMPKQLVVLFTECQRVGAAVMGIEYREMESTDDGETDWNKLVHTAKKSPDSPVVVRRPRATPFPVHLQMIRGGRDDDPNA